MQQQREEDGIRTAAKRVGDDLEAALSRSGVPDYPQLGGRVEPEVYLAAQHMLSDLRPATSITKVNAKLWTALVVERGYLVVDEDGMRVVPEGAGTE